MEIFDEEVKKFYLVYEDVHGNGYSFPCDETGSVLLEKISSPGNLAYCKAHPEEWAKNGEVETIVSRKRYGVCPRCGRRVYLGGCGWAAYMGVMECDCGQWYNIFGQAIKPPDEWEDDY